MGSQIKKGVAKAPYCRGNSTKCIKRNNYKGGGNLGGTGTDVL